jgi:hypothetical protein
MTSRNFSQTLEMHGHGGNLQRNFAWTHSYLGMPEVNTGQLDGVYTLLESNLSMKPFSL